MPHALCPMPYALCRPTFHHSIIPERSDLPDALCPPPFLHLDTQTRQRYPYRKVRKEIITEEGVAVLTSKVTSKGQITIPKKIRELLDIGKADQVAFVPLEKGKVLLTNKKNPAQNLFGMLRHRKLSRNVSIEEMNAAILKRRGARESAK